MALTDIIFDNISNLANRGNSGTVIDTTQNMSSLFLTSPVVGDVRVNVEYGINNSLSGTLNPAGGSSGYSRGRVVNA